MVQIINGTCFIKYPSMIKKKNKNNYIKDLQKQFLSTIIYFIFSIYYNF